MTATTGAGCGDPGSGVCDISPPHLIPFQFSTIQNYVLEFGTQYMRVIKDGGYVLETAQNITNITQANPAVVTLSTSSSMTNSDWIYVSGVGGMTEVNGQTYIVDNMSTNSFSLVTLDGAAVDSTGYGAYTTGGTVERIYTLTTPYDGADLHFLKYTQSADVMTLTHPDYAPRDLTRTGHANWTLTPITFAPSISPPTTVTATPSAHSGGPYLYRYVVTSVSEDGSEESRQSTHAEANTWSMSQTQGLSVKVKWNIVPGAGSYNIYRQAEINPDPDLGMPYGYVGQAVGAMFTDQNISPDFTRQPPQATNPFANGPVTQVIVDSGGTNYLSAVDTVSITSSTGSGWTGFIQSSGGVIVAIITLTPGENYTTSDTVSVTTATGSGFSGHITVGPTSGNNPACCCYFQQRKCFAGSTNHPDTIWMSQIGNFNNMDVSSPTRDSDAITATIASQQVNAIKFMVPMASGLIVGTTGGAWQVSGGQLGEPVTPSSIVAAPQAFNGVHEHTQPITINYDILYVQNKGSIVRDLNYDFYRNSYIGADMTVLAQHLFYGFQIEHWAWQEEPSKIVWATRSDGTLLSFTYMKEQEIYAWAHHDTQGKWITPCCITEGDEDVVYFVARREIAGINSGQPVYYVERMASRNFYRQWAWNEITNSLGGPDVATAWFLDCALQYPLVTPAACVNPSGTTGTIALISDTSVFDTTSVGCIVRINGGIGEITTVSSTNSAIMSVTVNLQTTTQAGSGDWTMTPPVTTVTGLDHLNGATVYALSSGGVEGPFVVSGGSITLGAATDVAVVGLLYVAQGQTLYLDTGAPTIQAKRKTIPSVTMRVYDSRGLQVGPDFDTLAQMKERTTEQMGQPTRLKTGDELINIQSQWRTPGQICWQQENPLPVTVLAVIPEVNVGDTGE